MLKEYARAFIIVSVIAAAAQGAEPIDEARRRYENGYPGAALEALGPTPHGPARARLEVRASLAIGDLERAINAFHELEGVDPDAAALVAAIARHDIRDALALAPPKPDLAPFYDWMARRVPTVVVAALASAPSPHADAAAAVAARLRWSDALPRLRRRMRTGDSGALGAAGAVARLTPFEAERGRCVRLLRREALSGPADRAARATDSLVRLGDEAAIEALRDVRGHAPSQSRRSLAERALALAGRTEVADGVLGQLERTEPGEALAAAEALGALRLRELLPRLRPILVDPRPGVRDAAAVAFARCGGIREAPRELLSCLLDARASGRHEARRALAIAIGGAMAVPVAEPEPALTVMLEVRVEAGGRRAAADAVARQLEARFEAFTIEPAAPDLLVVALRADLDPGAIASIAEALGACGHEVSIAPSP